MKNTHEITLQQSLHFVREITTAINQNNAPESVLDLILQACIESTGADTGSIMLLEYDKIKNQKFLQMRVSRGLPSNFSNLRLPIGEGITGWVALHGKSRIVKDARLETDYVSVREGLLSELAVPLIVHDEMIGVLSIDEREANAFGQIQQEFLSIMANLAAQIFVNLKDTHNVLMENKKLKQELFHRHEFGALIGHSEKMRSLFEMAKVVAASRSSVLITGESGTGKELIAAALHYNSPRSEGPFVKLNCAAIPSTLIESELFGHRKGAFTGAISDKKGKFEIADKGTIFLDEIGELELSLQSKLLRVLQEREIEPVGGILRPINIRVIAATNVNLEQHIKEKKFRSDLYYRLNVIHLHVPPLRERIEDLLPLTQHFIKKHTYEGKKKVRGITPSTIKLLEKYEWEGNVRQLENSIERAMVLTENEILNENDFTDIIQKLAPRDGKRGSSK